MGFDFQPELAGETLALRPLAAGDFDGLYAAASDPAVWAGHPVKDRHRREVFEPYFAFLLASGGTLVVADRSTDAIIGCSRYYVTVDAPDAVAIGFTFLDTAHWGGATNGELKRLMLEHAFRFVPEVWFHIGPDNIRSQKATTKLGAAHVRTVRLDISGAEADYLCFRLKRDDWQRDQRSAVQG